MCAPTWSVIENDERESPALHVMEPLNQRGAVTRGQDDVEHGSDLDAASLPGETETRVDTGGRRRDGMRFTPQRLALKHPGAFSFRQVVKFLAGVHYGHDAIDRVRLGSPSGGDYPPNRRGVNDMRASPTVTSWNW